LLDYLLITNLKLKDLNNLETLLEKVAILLEEEFQMDLENQSKQRKLEVIL